MAGLDEKEYIIHGPEIRAPIPEGSFGKILYCSLEKNCDLPTALIDGVTRKTVSFRTVLEKGSRLAYSLQKCGYKKGDVIAIASENSIHYVYPVLAGLCLGITVTTFNPYYTLGEISHASTISKPNIIFCSRGSLKSIVEARSGMKYLKNIIILDDCDNQGDIESMENFISKNSVDYKSFAPIDVESEHVALILFSSGTTGLPKGVMITHYNLNAANTNFRDDRFFMCAIPGSRIILGLMPFFHTYGLTLLVTGILFGDSVLVLPKFDGNLFLSAIQDFKLKSLPIVPSVAEFLVRSDLVNKYDLSHVQAIGSGAASLNRTTAKLLLERFKNLSVLQEGYGLTEATINVLRFPIGSRKLGSVGKLLPATSAKVVDNEGKTLGPGDKGELHFKGPQVMKGYVGDIESTQIIIDTHGWLKTGDVGYYDEEGFFYVVDRIKDLIKYKGFQVTPAELEGILLRHPKIKDAAVVGLPDEVAGELPLAFVVKFQDQEINEELVKSFVAKHVAPHKALRGGVRFIDEIPRNATGKILKKQLRELLTQKSKL